VSSEIFFSSTVIVVCCVRRHTANSIKRQCIDVLEGAILIKVPSVRFFVNKHVNLFYHVCVLFFEYFTERKRAFCLNSDILNRCLTLNRAIVRGVRFTYTFIIHVFWLLGVGLKLSLNSQNFCEFGVHNIFPIYSFSNILLKSSSLGTPKNIFSP